MRAMVEGKPKIESGWSEETIEFGALTDSSILRSIARLAITHASTGSMLQVALV